jgi:amino acid transporter
MNEQEEFFSPDHKRLLNIATWAKWLAWVVLVVFIYLAVGEFAQEVDYFNYYGQANLRTQNYENFEALLKDDYVYSFRLLVDVIGMLVRGATFFLVLMGISLGLNMIVETDINYREKAEGSK